MCELLGGSMSVDTNTSYFVYPEGIKRRGEEESREIFERKRRGVGEKMTSTLYKFVTSDDEKLLSCDFVTNPPKIANLLLFTVRLKNNEIVKLSDQIKSGQLEEIEKHTKDLAQIISTDPRMIENLDSDLFLHLFRFVEDTQNPNIQSQTISILHTYITFTINNKWVMDRINPLTLVNLIGSEDCQVKVQAMRLLCTMALIIPKPQFNATLEQALEPLSLLIQGDTIQDSMVLHGVSETLAVVCQVHPMLPHAKLEMVVNSLLKLFSYESSKIPPPACLGLLYLCDGRQEMVVGREYIEPLIHLLIEIVRLYIEIYDDPELHLRVTAALIALGTMVRWGSDEDIEVIILKNDALEILGGLLQEKDRDFVENACWIISNITAGEENHILAVIGSGLIERLFDVIENYKLLDVKKEAAWAISNALHGVSPDNLVDLRSRCLEPLWTILKVFRADQQIVSFCLEGLLDSGGVEVKCNDRLINAKGFKDLLVNFRGASPIDAIELLKLKKPRGLEPQLCVLGDNSNTAVDMEVDEPKSFWY
ncbi:hypothetical protein POM88_040081 [Heracleum sosnowskyi]|uniref:Importin subunit alpha n=1 Tax=Heracleum sosnowskyi TaxID=360622 RepID=A0AAD8HBK4_9APIA|nr:hypothetical protein POM88_040081 [Heracleum sosnowskyi]